MVYAQDYWGLSLRNDTHVPVVIRKVCLRMKDLQDESDKSESVFGSDLVLTYEGSGALLASSKTPGTDEHGYATLAPFTSGLWGTAFGKGSGEHHVAKSKKVIFARIEAQYITLFRQPKIVEVSYLGPHMPLFAGDRSDAAMRSSQQDVYAASKEP